MFLHREITNAPDGLIVDHIDHNGLNCQRENLRICTLSQNLYNKKRMINNKVGYKGVYKLHGKYAANCSRHHLGYYDTPEAAAHAYDAAAREFYGEFAYLNFPEAPNAR